MLTANQNPEQLARNAIDKLLLGSGWLVQSKKQINLQAGRGVAVREYQTEVGPAGYILFINKKPVGLIEAKREEEGVRPTMHEVQAEGYANAKLRPKYAGPTKYTAEQVQWLHMIKETIANSFHVDRVDFEPDPFNKQSGVGKMWQLFGEETDAIINELNERQVA